MCCDDWSDDDDDFIADLECDEFFEDDNDDEATFTCRTCGVESMGGVDGELWFYDDEGYAHCEDCWDSDEGSEEFSEDEITRMFQGPLPGEQPVSADEVIAIRYGGKGW